MWPSLTLATFFLLLSAYHILDFTIEHKRSGSRLSLDALLLSPWYCAAMALCLVEYALEWWVAPGWKCSGRASSACYFLGLAGMLFGDGLRKASMIQNKSFTHIIARVKRRDHELVTSGVYRVWRHPGYAGWYYWCVSSQVLLMNPASLLAFAVVGSWFFRDRVTFEEDTLAAFFGRKYAEYAARTGIWIPGVRGAFPYAGATAVRRSGPPS